MHACVQADNYQCRVEALVRERLEQLRRCCHVLTWSSRKVLQRPRKGFRQASLVTAQLCRSSRGVGTQLIRTRRKPCGTHTPQRQRPPTQASTHQRAPMRREGVRNRQHVATGHALNLSFGSRRQVVSLAHLMRFGVSTQCLVVL